MVALQNILQPQVLTKVISRQAATSDWITNLFGVQPGGSNEVDFGHGRNGAYHIYDNVRTLAKGRAPGTAAGRTAQNPMGRVSFTYPRMFDSVSLDAEVLHNLSQISNPAQRDEAGADWIRRQTMTLAQRASNWRKAMLVGMLRDSLYVHIDGDDQYFTFSSSGNAFQVSFQMPAGNKTQLNMLGGGNIINATWALATTDIPDHIGKINAAFQQLCGGHLAAVVCPQNVWQAVINNDKVAAIHGSATAPFRVLERDSLDPALANTTKNVYRATLNVYPDVIWYITDEGLDVGAPGSESYTKLVPDNNALFIGHNPSDGTVACYKGSEPVAEYDNAPEIVKRGLSSWSVKRSNPTTTELFALDNALTLNHIPKSHAYGTVIF